MFRIPVSLFELLTKNHFDRYRHAPWQRKYLHSKAGTSLPISGLLTCFDALPKSYRFRVHHVIVIQQLQRGPQQRKYFHQRPTLTSYLHSVDTLSLS
jgi:hypothetical protein